ISQAVASKGSGFSSSSYVSRPSTILGPNSALVPAVVVNGMTDAGSGVTIQFRLPPCRASDAAGAATEAALAMAGPASRPARAIAAAAKTDFIVVGLVFSPAYRDIRRLQKFILSKQWYRH